MVPLAALFDWGRKMFETREAIRKAAVERAIEKAVQRALEDERRRIATNIASWEQLRGLSPEDIKDRISQVGPDSGVNAS